MTVIGRRDDGHMSTVFAHPLRDATNSVMALRDDGVLHVLNMATGGAAHVLCVTPIRLKIAKGQLFSHLYGGICVWVGIISECVSVISELICCVIVRSQSTRMLTRSRTRSVGRVWGYVVLWFRHSAIKGIVVNLPSFGAHVEMNIDSPFDNEFVCVPCADNDRREQQRGCARDIVSHYACWCDSLRAHRNATELQQPNDPP